MAEREEIKIDETLDRNIYPPVNFHFRVLFEGLGEEEPNMGWQEVTGFANELGVEDLNEGGENRFSYRLPNRGKYSNLVLKRGTKIASKELIKWVQDAIDNFVFKPLEVSVYLLNVKHEPLISWKFHRAYPLKWSTSDLKAQDNAIVIETLELAYLGFTKTYHQPSDNKS